MNIPIYAVLSIFPLLGLLLLGVGARNVWRGVASASWPKASGVVLGPGAMADSVTVAYKVDGREYQTDAMRFGATGSSNPSDAEMTRLRYPKGAEVSVVHHPENPAIAALRPGFASDALLLPALGLALVLMGAIITFALLSSPGQMQGMGNMAPRIFGCVFMLVGLMLIVPGVRRLMRDHESLNWPKAPGVILFSTITASTTESRDNDRDSSTYGTTTTSTTFNSPLVFEFEVNGRKHYSNTRRFGQLAGSDENWAAEIAERYPTGAKVQVTYSPSDPDLAVLEPGITSEAYWLPGAGAAFFLFGLAAVVFIRF